ncbi:MAG: FixH family protein [Actinomycetota bacterium]|nr:FixH family protein [Actinomycetota bacterium]
MASTSAATENGRDHGGAQPILIVAGVAVAAFVVAFLVFRGGSKSSTVTAGNPTTTASGGTTAQGSGCATGTPDSSYTVSMDSSPNPPKAEGTVFHLTVRHNGTAVSGAQICMTADMTEMHHGGITNVAKESSGGKYDAELKFGMRGPYAGSVIIAEPGKPPVSVPVTFQVS